jgi:hypothetical protein
MAAYLRNQVFYALKSVLSPLNLLSSFSNDQGSDRSCDEVASVSSHVSSSAVSQAFSKHDSSSKQDSSRIPQQIEPRLERIAIRATQAQNSHAFPKPNSQPEAMTDRDGRRAPVLHAGESAQRRLF